MLVVTGGMGVHAQSGDTIPPHFSQIAFPEDIYVPPHPADHRVELPGGVVAYLVPDSTLDLVRFTLIATGPFMPAHPGEAVQRALYSALLVDGGTKNLTPAQLEDSLEFMAAGLTASRGTWQGEASFDALSADADALLGLLADAILEPRLDSAVFDLKRRQLIEGIRRRHATPQGVMAALHEHVLHGPHPSNWRATEQEARDLAPASLAALAGRGFARTGAVVAVAGRFDRDAMRARLEDFAATLPEARTAWDPPVPPFRGPLAPGVYLVDRPFAQATIRMAAPGVQRPHPDYYALVVASEVFGGGFTSRLGRRVRSDEGLAYSVGSRVESDYHRRGTVFAGLQTKAETGAFAIHLVREEMLRMADSGITGEELELARSSLLESLPAIFPNPAATARAFAQSEAWGRDLDHFVNYRTALEAMTREQVEDAFRRYFVADSLRILVTGPKDVLLQRDPRGHALEDFGTITELTEEDLDARE